MSSFKLGMLTGSAKAYFLSCTHAQLRNLSFPEIVVVKNIEGVVAVISDC